jgi:hypothetical protein
LLSLLLAAWQMQHRRRRVRDESPTFHDALDVEADADVAARADDAALELEAGEVRAIRQVANASCCVVAMILID